MTTFDERVNAFMAWLIESDWPYLWLDATYVKIRRDHHTVSIAVIGAVGVNTDGRREMLGMTTGQSEAKRHSEVVGIFPNEAAVTRLLGAPLLEPNNGCAVQRASYMTLETIAPLGDDIAVSLQTMAA